MMPADILQHITLPIAEELHRFDTRYSESIASPNALLQQVLNHTMQHTGKRIRPLLVLLSAKALGNINTSTIDAAVAFEMLHNASLLHDDVVDHADQRRGIPTVNHLWGNRIAVLVGDYLLAKAIDMATATGNERIVNALANVGRHLADGELEQLNRQYDASLDTQTNLRIIDNKTGSLISACTSCGAISIGASDDHITLTQQIGIDIGRCFQIKDDILDYNGTDTGKPTHNDIREGKITLPLICALDTATETERRHIDTQIHILSSDPDNTQAIHEIADFVEHRHGIELATHVMLQHHRHALNHIALLPANDASRALATLTNYIIERER